ncbi:MBL fold metallo-hydrolase [Sporosarcina sp. Te-1]|uniref:MBL fold metallo-hydrolase n=1 Tax=Sporosarcina sp. Te-1 TaxID=2818390 RepID=UPI001A9EE425|nr:MBL fold metallo-hydrolase [Sporosarcina sp. Te-1]QTD40307.1 MBL fold metallo-hydrolase [Sporosarcina sp. Te-1]
MVRKRYNNLDSAATTATFKEILRWQQERRAKQKDESFRIGQAEVKQQTLLNSDHDKLTITWIGHSTFLLQIAGLTIITDPVWANRMGFSRRLEEPGLSLEEMPPVDVILLSHSHYDHLHVGSLKKMKGSPIVLVPEGLGQFVRKLMKGNQVHELPWWGHMSIGALEFHFVPAQHWTKRTLTDTNTSHWGGWVIQRSANAVHAEVQADSIYFAGDSGYFQGFREIGERFPAITYALMPIGAYEPEWFMGPQHVTPEEAIQAFLDVGAKLFIPMHYGAFRLADDTTEEALDRLLAEWERRKLDSTQLRLLKHGETLIKATVLNK